MVPAAEDSLLGHGAPFLSRHICIYRHLETDEVWHVSRAKSGLFVAVLVSKPGYVEEYHKAAWYVWMAVLHRCGEDVRLYLNFSIHSAIL